MLSPPKNRVQSIKDKFENLRYSETAPLVRVRTSRLHLCKQTSLPHEELFKNESEDKRNNPFASGKKSDGTAQQNDRNYMNETSPKPNSSYLYKSSDNSTSSESRRTLSRQSSDPGKKLHRSHAFRCDRSKIVSPKRHGSCKSRSELNDSKMDGKLSEERLKRLGHVLEKRMKLENFVSSSLSTNRLSLVDNNEGGERKSLNIPVIDNSSNIHESPTLPMPRNSKLEENPVPYNSVPDEEVPKHILDQYAKVVKAKKQEEAKNDGMTDSGVSSETENLEDDKVNKIQKLKSQFEKTDSNLKSMDYLCASSETMRLEKKNPHVKLTDTLKKALKQPLPPGPPPQKPPRSFTPPKEKKDAKKMLQKLEQVLEQRESQQKTKNIYDIAEIDRSLTRPKEIHYLCTEILDITNKKLLPSDTPSPDPFPNCFSLNCAIIPKESTLSLPYTRLSESNPSSVQACCCSKENLQERRLSTFLSDKPCEKCFKIPRNTGLQCEKECIYDVPYFGVDKESKELPHVYGSLNRSKSASLSRSLDDLRVATHFEDKIIYDIPCEVSRSPSPEFVTSSPKTNIEKLRQNFENITNDGEKNKENKKPPLLTPKPNLEFLSSKNKFSKSTENIPEAFRLAKNSEKKFATEKRYKKNRSNLQSLSLVKCVDIVSGDKKEYPLEKDRENLTRLMNEIYETVTAACDMEDHKPGCFPTDHQDSTTTEDSVKIHRSLTEKRKNYVRRVSSKVAYLDPNNIRTRRQTSVCSYNPDKTDVENPYSTFRSWKSFRKSSYTNIIDKSKMAFDRKDSIDSKINLTDSRGNILSMKDEFSMNDSLDNLSIDEKTGCVDITLPFERERGLFKVCLLVGLNYMTGEAYVKSVFPTQVKLPPHIENLIYPETLSDKVTQRAADVTMQCYSLVLTDERGERAYGYCRRVVPEGASTCLPLCYCLIGKYRAPGFYYKVLQEIESHHGSSELEISSILQQLFETDFPEPGREISISYCKQNDLYTDRDQAKLDELKSKTMPGTRMYNNKDVIFNGDVKDLVKSASEKDCVGQDAVFYTQKVPAYYDLENNNANVKMYVDYTERRKVLKRPLEPRVDEDNLSVLLDSLGSGLLIKVFGSLLLERKVVIISDNLSQLSSCMEGLQALLYPLVWQQPLISTIPAEIRRDVLDAPLPVLAGVLKATSEHFTDDVTFDEGMLLDLTEPGKVIHYQGDESTILPTSSFKTLKTTLQMEPVRRGEDTPTRNILISEAFLRFFVNVLGDFWRFFVKNSDRDTEFDKETFIRSSSSKQNQYFLEWFTETAMFNHFIQNMATIYNHRQSTNSTIKQTQTTQLSLVDAPLPDFYQIFEDRIQNSSKTVQKSVDNKNNYKNLMNKRVKVLKTKLKDLVT